MPGTRIKSYDDHGKEAKAVVHVDDTGKDGNGDAKGGTRNARETHDSTVNEPYKVEPKADDLIHEYQVSIHELTL